MNHANRAVSINSIIQGIMVREVLGKTIGCAIGSGSYGTIYLVEEDNDIVFKMSRPTDNDSFFHGGIIHEIFMGRLLGHHSCINTPGEHYLTERRQGFFMEKCCRNLANYVHSLHLSGFDKSEILYNVRCVIYNIILGLVHIHDKGVIHTDLSLGNIMLRADNSVTIIDFGLSRIKGFGNPRMILSNLGAHHVDCVNVKKSMCPTYDGSFDMWSVGKIIYQMMTGTSPCKGFVRMPPNVHELPSFGDDDLDDLLTKLLDPNPKKRPTARQALEHPFFFQYSSLTEKMLSESSLIFHSDPSYYRYQPRKIEVDKEVRITRAKVIDDIYFTGLLNIHEFYFAVRLIDIYWCEKLQLEPNYVDNLTVLAMMIIAEITHINSPELKADIFRFLTVRKSSKSSELFRADIANLLCIPPSLVSESEPDSDQDSDSEDIPFHSTEELSTSNTILFNKIIEVLEFFDYRIYYDSLSYHVDVRRYDLCKTNKYLLNNHRLAEFTKEQKNK